MYICGRCDGNMSCSDILPYRSSAIYVYTVHIYIYYIYIHTYESSLSSTVCNSSRYSPKKTPWQKIQHLFEDVNLLWKWWFSSLPCDHFGGCLFFISGILMARIPSKTSIASMKPGWLRNSHLWWTFKKCINEFRKKKIYIYSMQWYKHILVVHIYTIFTYIQWYKLINIHNVLIHIHIYIYVYTKHGAGRLDDSSTKG